MSAKVTSNTHTITHTVALIAVISSCRNNTTSTIANGCSSWLYSMYVSIAGLLFLSMWIVVLVSGTITVLSLTSSV